MTGWGMRVVTTAFLAVGLTGIMPFRPAGSAPTQGPDSVELRVGRTFRTTVFPSLEDGRPGSVADFRGKKLILHIFASW